jgi:hypothetical protein
MGFDVLAVELLSPADAMVAFIATPLTIVSTLSALACRWVPSYLFRKQLPPNAPLRLKRLAENWIALHDVSLTVLLLRACVEHALRQSARE